MYSGDESFSVEFEESSGYEGSSVDFEDRDSYFSDFEDAPPPILMESIPSMHEERFGASVATIDDDSFVVLGGVSDVDDPVGLTSCEVYNASTKTWTLLPEDMPEYRYGCAAATVGRHIYVVGGDVARKSVSTMVAYSLDEKKWVSKKSMKKARERCAAAASNGRLFVFGGRFDDARRNTEVYDPQTDKWKDLPPMPIERLDCKAVAVDGKIYICGGNNANGKHLAAFDIFNTTTEQWEDGPDMPVPRTGHAVVAVGRSIVVIGGQDDECDQLLSTHIYDVDDKEWSDGLHMISERSEHVAAAVSGGKVVIAGGADTESNFLDTAEALQFVLNGTKM